MELQTWELTDEQYKRLVAKSEELHALCRELRVPVIVAMQVGNDKNVFGHEGYSSFDLDRTCVNMLVFASVFDILLGAEAVTSEDMTKLMNTIHEIHHKYYGKHQNMEVIDAAQGASNEQNG